MCRALGPGSSRTVFRCRNTLASCSALLSAANSTSFLFQDLCQLLWDQCCQCGLEHHHLCLRCSEVVRAYSWMLTVVFAHCSSSCVICVCHECKSQGCCPNILSAASIKVEDSGNLYTWDSPYSGRACGWDGRMLSQNIQNRRLSLKQFLPLKMNTPFGFILSSLNKLNQVKIVLFSKYV